MSDVDNQVRHLAIIMDGNNRWAKAQGLPGNEGHKAGEAAVQLTVEHCVRKGIEVLTVFAFSSENWQRPEDEVQGLMQLFLNALTQRVDELNSNGVCLHFMGDLSAFTSDLRDNMSAAEQLTQSNTRLRVNVAVNYGGRWDIVHAAKKIAADVSEGELSLDDVTEASFAKHMSLSDLPAPDLCIRTAGEQRISNFMLWQMAYTEFYFSEAFWPDFDEPELDKALSAFSARQRRFGKR